MTTIFINHCTDNERVFRRRLVMDLFALYLWMPSQAITASTLNIYSHRQQLLVQPFLDAFTRSNGFKTNHVFTAEVSSHQLNCAIKCEYAVNSVVAPPTELAIWSAVKRIVSTIERLMDLAPEAQMTVDQVRW